MKHTEALISFIESSPSAYHTVDTVSRILLSAGAVKLAEGNAAPLEEGGLYFTVRGGSSLIAFRYHAAAAGFRISAAHTDSPAFRVKMTAERAAAAYGGLEVEKYGGMIYSTWFDRPLSVAGRVLVRTAEGLSVRLCNIDRDLLVIPSVAIHMNRTVNDGYKYNPAADLLPLFSADAPKGDFLSAVAAAVGAKTEDIVSHDLFLYNRERGRAVGDAGEFLLSPRLDDLACVYACLRGFLDGAGDGTTVPVLALFHNEEVGSDTKQGAGSTFLADTLRRIGGERTAAMLADAFMVSADNAHAKHPNHPELCDPDHAPLLGRGVAVKFNASERYATDGFSDAVFREVCTRAGVPTQTYYNRADMPGGSTLGSISDTKVSVPTVDIGIPQLAMHSATELCAAADVDGTVAAMTAYYGTPFHICGDDVTFG